MSALPDIPSIIIKKFLIDNLLGDLRVQIEQIEHQRHHNAQLSLADVLMSAFAIFQLKLPSLLQFDQLFRFREPNMKAIFQITQCPSDTAMRHILDDLPTEKLHDLYKYFVTSLMNSTLLDDYKFYNNKYLVAIDGVEYFESKKVSCPCCLTRQLKNGTTDYHHNLLATVIIHPSHREVFPMLNEPISNADGDTKNDCELNAVKRLLVNIKKNYQDTKFIYVADTLYSCGTVISPILAEGNSYILGICDSHNGILFIQFERLKSEKKIQQFEVIQDGKKHLFSYANDLFLNGTHSHISVNMLYYEEIDLKTGKKQVFSWVTDIPLSTFTVFKVMQGGRARWKIENETFNTLKNQGYEFEHNYGHGQKNLCNNLAMIMLLAFLIDQIITKFDINYQKALLVCKNKRVLFERIRSIFDLVLCTSMKQVYQIVSKIIKLTIEISP